MTPDELEFHEYFIEPCLPQVKNSLRPASQCARNFTANQPVYSRLLTQEVDPNAKSRLIHQLYQIEDDPEYAAQLADLLYGHSGDWQYGLRFIRDFMNNNTSSRDTSILRLLSKNGRVRGRLLEFLEHHGPEIYEKLGQHRRLCKNFYESLVPTATNSEEMMQVHRIRENSPDASLKMAAFWTNRLGQHTLGPWRN
ncbi:unnamed protein product, partial [Mesorhabditis spiculigera]